MTTTMWLAITMAVLGIVNTALQAWLWTYPMEGEHSTAPRSWTNVHRVIGYVFLLVYVALLTEMVPRMWEFRAERIGVEYWHGALGASIGVVLLAKIMVIRRFRRWGHQLPWFGGAILALTLVTVGLVVPAAWRIQAPFATPAPGTEPQFALGRTVVSNKCIQCHGPVRIAGEDGDWLDITEDMQEYSREIPGKVPITDAERLAAAAYLMQVLGDDKAEDDLRDAREEAAEEASGDERGRRGRGRGRGRGGRE